MMEWGFKRQTMRHYDKIANIYDRQYSDEQTSKMKAALQILEQKPSGLVLDVGCGTGLLFKHLEKQAKLLVGVDFSRRILEIAKEKSKRNNNVELVQADADHLPFNKQVFDVAFAVTLIQNMPNPSRTLKEIREITKNCGYLVVTALKKKYSKKLFTETLQKAGLEIKGFLDRSHLKGYVAVCAKIHADCSIPLIKVYH